MEICPGAAAPRERVPLEDTTKPLGNTTPLAATVCFSSFSELRQLTLDALQAEVDSSRPASVEAAVANAQDLRVRSLRSGTRKLIPVVMRCREVFSQCSHGSDSTHSTTRHRCRSSNSSWWALQRSCSLAQHTFLLTSHRRLRISWSSDAAKCIKLCKRSWRTKTWLLSKRVRARDAAFP